MLRITNRYSVLEPLATVPKLWLVTGIILRAQSWAATGPAGSRHATSTASDKIRKRAVIPAMTRPKKGASNAFEFCFEITCAIGLKSTFDGRNQPPRPCDEPDEAPSSITAAAVSKQGKGGKLPRNSGFCAARPIQPVRFCTIKRSRPLLRSGGRRGHRKRAKTIPRGRTGIDRMLEVRIACRGWSAGHVKSRPSFNC